MADDKKASPLNTATAAEDHKKSGDEDESESSSRLTRLRAAAVALSSARRNSAAAAARRSISKAKTSIAYRTSRTSFSQPIRRSSRMTPGSKKANAEEQAAIDEAVRQKNELEAINKNLAEPYIMETVDLEFNGVTYCLADIVSMMVDRTGNRKCYARITGFFTNRYAERFVAIRWLLPKKFRMTPRARRILTKIKGFRMSLYHEGPLNDDLMPMEHITFVMRPAIDCGKFGEPFKLYKDGRWNNIVAERTLASAVGENAGPVLRLKTY